LEATQPLKHQTEQRVQPQTCAWILHGLNTHPKKMSALRDYLSKHSSSASIGVLSGHHPEAAAHEKITAANWKSEFSSQWKDAVSQCNHSSDRRIFAGYSLGALVALSLLDGASDIPAPTHMVLIAPALKLRKKVNLVKALSWLPFGALPSLNHEEYRARSWTTLSAYDALFDLNKNWQQNSWKFSKKIPTVMFLARQDELVDSQTIAHDVENFSHWKTVWISNEKSRLKPAYHHLMLDEASVGKDSWTRIQQEIDLLLNTKSEIWNSSGD